MSQKHLLKRVDSTPLIRTVFHFVPAGRHKVLVECVEKDTPIAMQIVYTMIMKSNFLVFFLSEDKWCGATMDVVGLPLCPSFAGRERGRGPRGGKPRNTLR